MPPWPTARSKTTSTGSLPRGESYIVVFDCGFERMGSLTSSSRLIFLCHARPTPTFRFHPKHLFDSPPTHYGPLGKPNIATSLLGLGLASWTVRTFPLVPYGIPLLLSCTLRLSYPEITSQPPQTETRRGNHALLGHPDPIDDAVEILGISSQSRDDQQEIRELESESEWTVTDPRASLE